jgi:hypothetical protein
MKGALTVKETFRVTQVYHDAWTLFMTYQGNSGTLRNLSYPLNKIKNILRSDDTLLFYYACYQSSREKYELNKTTYSSRAEALQVFKGLHQAQNNERLLRVGHPAGTLMGERTLLG